MTLLTLRIGTSVALGATPVIFPGGVVPPLSPIPPELAMTLPVEVP